MNIKDCLHLYLGCECRMTKPSYHAVHELHLSCDRTFVLTGRLLHYFIDDTTKADIKLILRPLSDMTEEEFLGIFKPIQPEDVTNDQLLDAINNLKSDGYECLDFGGMDAIAVFEIFRKLLSKHFDLFNLIENNLAIDKTTLK